MKFLFAFVLSLVSTASADEGAAPTEGALEVIYNPIVCVMAPCPQFRIVKINGAKPTGSASADIRGLKLETLPKNRPFIVMGTWTQERDYFQVTAREAIFSYRERAIEK